MTDTDESGTNPVGAAMGCALTIGCRESGAVCITVPLWPSLIPLCESRIAGLRVLSDAANAVDVEKDAVSEAAMATARKDFLSVWAGCMSGPVGF